MGTTHLMFIARTPARIAYEHAMDETNAAMDEMERTAETGGPAWHLAYAWHDLAIRAEAKAADEWNRERGRVDA